MPLFSKISEKLATLWGESSDDLDSDDLNSVGLLDAEERKQKRAARLTGDGRYCTLLAARESSDADQVSLVTAWKALEDQMTLTPAGTVELVISMPVATQTGFAFAADSTESVDVDAFYIDRFAVTNAEFAQFVADGGYSNVELWPPEVLAQVLQFVDKSGNSGPRFWSQGQPPEDKLDHPVVGVCWYEARAYAKWAGKRLPTSAEWQQAGCWRTNEVGRGTVMRYPWGSAFDPKKANTWSSQCRETVPVDEYQLGCTPNGIYQLIGNVWEWVGEEWEIRPGGEGIRIVLDQPMAEIRGGGFDTYFDSQATSQFRTGQFSVHRNNNTGFRCCVGADDLKLPPDPSAFLQDDDR